MPSNVAETRRELQALRSELRVMQREIRTYRSVVSDALRIASQLGITDARSIQALIMLLMSLKAAYDAVQYARMAAGDPLAWATAGLSVLSTVIAVGGVFVRDMTGSEGPQ